MISALEANGHTSKDEKKKAKNRKRARTGDGRSRTYRAGGKQTNKQNGSRACSLAVVTVTVTSISPNRQKEGDS